jgi:ubiquinone/menaquinone biosynthesis C-methylase UbiE
MDETARVRAAWDRAAPGYDRAIAWFERSFVGDARDWIAGRAAGEVLEVGIGTGRNLGRYPPGVALTGVDLSPAMLAVARDRAAALGVDVRLVEGDAQALDLPDAAFDTVVATLALCAVPDDRRAVAELVRVLRPGGRLLLLDHVVATNRAARLVQRALDPLARRIDGDHLLRRPRALVEAAGLAVEEAERTKLGVIERLSARRPA